MKINQFSFLEIWNDPFYVNEQLRPIDYPVRNMRLFCGRDGDGNPLIALSGKTVIAVKAGRIGKLSWKVKFGGAGSEAFLFITMKDPDMTNFFAVFAAALVSEIETSEKNLDSVIRNYCEEWQLIFGESNYLQKIVGIIGELFFLSKVLEKGLTDVTWNEGSMSPQDFSVHGKKLVEVKTTCSHSSYSVRFHGVEQLHCPDGFQLHVVFIRMIRCDGGEYSIESLVNRVPASYISQATLEKIEKLSEEARTTAFACVETVVCKVDDGFPRITRDTLRNIPHPDMIEDVDYEVNLQGVNGVELGEFTEDLRRDEDGQDR